MDESINATTDDNVENTADINATTEDTIENTADTNVNTNDINVTNEDINATTDDINATTEDINSINLEDGEADEYESSPSIENISPPRATSTQRSIGHASSAVSEVSQSQSHRKASSSAHSVVSESLLRTTTARVMDSKAAERIRTSRDHSDVKSVNRDTASVVSESLLKTTTARVMDSKEAEKIRSSRDNSDCKSINRDAVVAPPSEHLTRPTQARIYDELHLQSRKGVIKHEDDPFWEIRKPLALANNKKFNQVESKLLEPTTATIFYQRKKHTESPEKSGPHHSPESTLKGAGSIVSTPTGVTSVRHIDPDSHLLTQTTNSVIKNVKIALPSPPPPALELPTQSSTLGPRGVESKLLQPTTALARGRWKSKEDLEAERLSSRHKSPYKVLSASDHLLEFNKNMQHRTRPKANKPAPDQREAGWNNVFRFDRIPDVENVTPLRGYSPDRTRSPPSERKSSSAQHSPAQSQLVPATSELDERSSYSFLTAVPDDAVRSSPYSNSNKHSLVATDPASGKLVGSKADDADADAGGSKKIALLAVEDGDVAVMQQLLNGQLEVSEEEQLVDEFDESKAY